PRYETLFSQTTADDSTGNLRYQRVCCYFESPSRYGLFDTSPRLSQHIFLSCSKKRLSKAVLDFGDEKAAMRQARV
ncbi:MAG: hypothetical protein PUC47_06830, partial [Oscillospiraceae bacterium]|nr:hypothetical protein [Oscillospiraceae bacterium]